jgi:hypothetical protein
MVMYRMFMSSTNCSQVASIYCAMSMGIAVYNLNKKIIKVTSKNKYHAMLIITSIHINLITFKWDN